MFGHNPVQFFPHPQNFLRLDTYVRGLALEAAQGLVNQYPGVGQGKPFPFGARGQQQRRHGRPLAHAQGGHRALDVLHGVVYRHPRGHQTAGGVDVKVDFLVGILCLQKQQLGDHQVGDIIIDGRPQKDDPVP